MADTAPPLFQFTTQEDWYGSIPILNGDAGNAPLELAGRAFEMWITPATQGGTLVDPVRVLTMQTGGGLEFAAGGANTFIFRVARSVAITFPRGDFTADLLEVVDGERHLFMPIRIRYGEPSGILAFLSRAFAVAYAASRQPIVTSIGVPGRQGSPGATIITGTVPPVPADGKDGDYWIEDRTGAGLGRRMYGPKAGGAWPGSPFTIQVARYQDVPGLTGALADAALSQTTQELAGPPTDLPVGKHRLVWNTAKNRASLWMNRGGDITDAFDPGTF